MTERYRGPRLPAAGWMPDPSETHLERYWDGTRWTPRTRDRYTRIETGVVPPPSDVNVRAERSPTRRSTRRVFMVLTVGVVLVTGYLYASRIGVAPTVSQVASAVTEAAKPNDADVDYPAFGSTELVHHLERGMIAQQARIDVTYWARVDGIDAVKDAMSEASIQNPYVFAGAWQLLDGTGTVEVAPDYVYEKTEADRRRAAVASAVATGLSQSGALAASDDALKVSLIHDFIIGTAEYNYDAFDAINRGEEGPIVQESQEAYGILVNGTAVCNGYAQAFNAMAQAAGLTSVEVTGSDSSGVTGGSHAWNKVLVDDRWLLVDTTWDDTGDEGRLDYLLLADDAPLLVTRTQDADWVTDSNLADFAS